MESTTIRVKKRTAGTLRSLASLRESSISDLVEALAEAERKRLFWERVNASYAALKADPEAWAEELEERRSLEGTLMDDLHDDPWEED
jgi:hypothetical protein